VLLSSQIARAQNVDLATLPNRDTVQLTIYNSEDITLAKETRSITLKKGMNRLQFSWAGTLIDPTSVQFRPLEHADQIEVADTVFLGQKPQHLIWNVQSEFEGQALVEVSYFTSGLTWQMDYVAVSNPEETQMKFRGYVRVSNNSGEEYKNAEIRLIVGKINLVEKIADLARRDGKQPPKPATARFEDLRQRAALKSFSLAEGASAGPAKEGKKVVKEGVGEYFMFSVDGTETVPNGWSKRMQAVTADDVEFDIVYRMRAYQYGPRPVRFIKWPNDKEHKLGDSPLPNGVVRVFRENGSEGLSYLGNQVLRYVPIQAPVEVNLGVDDLVVYDQRKTSTSRSDFQFNRHSQVTGWDERQGWVHTLRNYRSKPIQVELRLQWAGDVEVTAESEASSFDVDNDDDQALRVPTTTTSFDYRTIAVELMVPVRGKTEYVLSSVIHHGANAKQNRVRLLKTQ